MTKNKKKLIIIIAILFLCVSGYIGSRLYSAHKYREIGLDAWYAREYKLAEKAYRKGLGFNPYSRTLKHALADTLSILDKLDEAEEIYKELLPKSPKSKELLSSLGYINTAKKKYDDAEHYYVLYAQYYPDDIIGYGGMARVYKGKGDYKKALEYAIKATDYLQNIRPLPVENWTVPLLDVTELYIILDNYEKALESTKAALNVALAAHEYNTPVYLELAKIYEYMKDKDNAIATLQKFIDSKPEKKEDLEYAKKRIEEIEKGNFLTPPKQTK